MRTNEYGRTMIEMIGVLGIMGLLSVGGIAGFGKVLANYKINQAIEQISIISAKLSSIGAKGSDYTNLDNTSAIKFGAIPNEAITDSKNGILQNPLGGSILVEASNLEANADDNMAYTITYGGLNREACLRMAATDYGSGETSSVIGWGTASSNGEINNIYKNLYQGCSGEFNDMKKYVVACYGGKIAIPITIATAHKACDCGKTSGCVFVIKYF